VRWLLDEMLPRVAAKLPNRRGHDAVAVHDVELAGAADPDIFDHAVADRRLVVTENFADYSLLVAQRLSNDHPAYVSSSSTSPTSRAAARWQCIWPSASIPGPLP
jgi:hypothetical protein